MTATCPSWPTLLGWLENDLPDEKTEVLLSHVPQCVQCQEKLALMDAVDGELRA